MMMRATSPSASAYVFWILSARISAARRPACALSVAKNEMKAFDSGAEPMATIFALLAASSTGLLIRKVLLSNKETARVKIEKR